MFYLNDKTKKEPQFFKLDLVSQWQKQPGGMQLFQSIKQEF